MAGGLPDRLAQLMGGAVLVLSFALLYQRRVVAAINFYALQAVALAAAAFWHGWVQDTADLYVTALITLAASGVAIPTALHRIVRRLAIDRRVETALGIFPSMALGAALVALALSVVLPTAAPAEAPTRLDLALALSVVLLGGLTMIARRSAIAQAIGFLSLANGLILAAVSVPGMPLVVALSLAVLVLAATVVFGGFFCGIREHFDSLGGAPR